MEGNITYVAPLVECFFGGIFNTRISFRISTDVIKDFIEFISQSHERRRMAVENIRYRFEGKIAEGLTDLLGDDIPF